MTRTPEFIQLLTGTQSRLYGYILSLVGDSHDASDVLQETNAILWEKESEFEIGTNFIAWSFRIAYYQVLAYRKKGQRDRLSFDTELLSSISEVAEEEDQLFNRRQSVLRQCLKKLNARQQAVIQRRYQTGSTLESIAAETGSKVNAIKQLLFRARNSLSTCVRQAFIEELTS